MPIRKLHTKSTSGRTHRLTVGDESVMLRYPSPPAYDDQVQGDLVRRYWFEGGKVRPIVPMPCTVDPSLDAEETPLPPRGEPKGDPGVRWLVVRGGERNRVERYLYASASLFSTENGPQPTHLVVVASPRGNVDYLADYQAERLRSGLMGAIVYETFAEAVAAMA